MPDVAGPSDESLGPQLRAPLLDWAERSLRDLPWRRTRDPWRILVAETMLQQTQVSRVVDRWGAFLDRYPDPAACAAAGPAAIVRAWAGLGYNRRALMLHRAAAAIRDRHDGRVPEALDELLALPGVGPYTARAVRAFAFEVPAAPLDTNVGRVLARLHGRSFAGAEAQRRADELVPVDAVWRWNQGLMELGAMVCTKRAPSCDSCPLSEPCRWRATGPDPAHGSAAVGRPQGRFEGSDRQLRGRLVDALRQGPVDAGDVPAVAGVDDRARTDRVLRGLRDDGLVECRAGRLWLAGDDQPGPVSEARS